MENNYDGQINPSNQVSGCARGQLWDDARWAVLERYVGHKFAGSFAVYAQFHINSMRADTTAFVKSIVAMDQHD